MTSYRRLYEEEKQKNLRLIGVIHQVFWMARRYAHGRHTYAPSIIRDEYRYLAAIGIKIKKDITIESPTHELVDVGSRGFREDFLDDVND